MFLFIFFFLVLFFLLVVVNVQLRFPFNTHEHIVRALMVFMLCYSHYLFWMISHRLISFCWFVCVFFFHIKRWHNVWFGVVVVAYSLIVCVWLYRLIGFSFLLKYIYIMYLHHSLCCCCCCWCCWCCLLLWWRRYLKRLINGCWLHFIIYDPNTVNMFSLIRAAVIDVRSFLNVRGQSFVELLVYRDPSMGTVQLKNSK